MAAQDWELSRLHGKHDWSLTNTSGTLARNVYIEFRGMVDGRRWTEGITPANVTTTIGQITPGETIYINIHMSETVDKVSVRWRTGFRKRRWDKTEV